MAPIRHYLAGNQNGRAEEVNLATSDQDDDANSAIVVGSTEPDENIVEGSSVERSDGDFKMTETDAGSDAEIAKPVTKGPKGKKRRIPSVELQPSPPPRAKRRSHRALVNRFHSEEEPSAEESDQGGKRSALRKVRSTPAAKASVRTSSRKHSSASEVSASLSLARFSLTKSL